MHNFSTVFWFEFFRTVKKKTFWISVLAFPIVMGIVFTLVYISGKSAKSAGDRALEERFSMVILDKTGLVSDSMLAEVGATRAASPEAGEAAVRRGAVEAFITYPKEPSKEPITVIAKDVGLVKNGKYTGVAKEILRIAAAKKVGNPEQVAIIRGDVHSTLTAYDAAGNVAGGFERVIAPGLFLLLLYLVIILLGNQMLTSTIEEKENRVIEMILTTVGSRALILGKIAALVLVGILQITIIALPLVVAIVFFGDVLPLPAINLGSIPFPAIPMLIGAALFAASFLLFTGILVGIGAAVPTAKEAGSFFGITMFFMFVPLYAFSAIVTDPTQIIVKIFSFFPLSAPMTLLLRNAAGNLSVHEALLGITIVGVSAVIVLFGAIRIFRYGVLEYERKMSLKDIFRR